jgi:hypothetical protein
VKSKTRFFAIAVVCFLLMLAPIYFAKSQASSNTVVSISPPQTSVQVGKTFVINITLSDVENLYGLDLTLDYNNSVVHLVSAKPDGSDLASAAGFLGTASIPGGVLYGSPLINDANAINSGCLYYNTSLSTVNEYHLFATSVNPASSFNGSGTIASLTFSVLASGHSDLSLNSTLADHPDPGETTSEAIPHTDVSASVDVGQVPEFPFIAALAVLAAVVTSTLFFAKKKIAN